MKTIPNVTNDKSERIFSMIDECRAFDFSVHNASIDSVAIMPFRKINVKLRPNNGICNQQIFNKILLLRPNNKNL